MDNNFKPYVPADKVTPEFTVTSIVMGLILAVVFGAANAYLGLRVGMTVSASIPAAVISMGVIRKLLKKDSILESNMVQTIGSAGESLAVAIGLYLPLELSSTIMAGGLIRYFIDKKEDKKEGEAGSGVLFCSGMIAGEGLVGILLAILAVMALIQYLTFQALFQQELLEA